MDSGRKSSPLKSTARKSVRTGAPMRSKGFLGRPDGATNAPSPDEDIKLSHKSRGSRAIHVSANGKPAALGDKPRIKPYRLDKT